MIWLDDKGEIVIRTQLHCNQIDEIVEMKRSVLNLLNTQSQEFIYREENYWAYRLVQLLEPEADQICLQK